MVTPAGWKEVRLGDHALFFKGNGLSKSQLIDDGPQMCIHYGQLFTHYGPVIDSVASRCVAFEGSFKSQVDDVLMPGSDVTPRGLATASAVRVFDVVLGGDVIVIRAKPESLYGPFLSNFIRMSKGRVLRLVKGSTVYHIHAKDLADLEVLMPPLKEQEAIAEALGDADVAIASLDALIAKKREVKQAAMQQLLTGRTRLPGFTADWKEVCLGEICELSLAASKKSRGDGRGRFIIADMGSVSKDGLFLTHKTTDSREDVLRLGDLVMPKDDIGGGQIIGKAVLVDEDERYVLGDHVYRLRLSDGHPPFVRYAINSYKVNMELRSKVVGSAQLGLGRRSVLEQPVAMPPLKEQEAIAEALGEIDQELAALTGQASKLRMIKEGMMQGLLTGKVRLPC